MGDCLKQNVRKIDKEKGGKENMTVGKNEVLGGQWCLRMEMKILKGLVERDGKRDKNMKIILSPSPFPQKTKHFQGHKVFMLW